MNFSFLREHPKPLIRVNISEYGQTQLHCMGVFLLGTGRGGYLISTLLKTECTDTERELVLANDTKTRKSLGFGFWWGFFQYKESNILPKIC